MEQEKAAAEQEPGAPEKNIEEIRQMEKNCFEKAYNNYKERRLSGVKFAKVEPVAPGAKKKPARKKADILKVFTFSIKGLSYYFNTVEEMHAMKEKYELQGRTIDPHSIDIIEVEKPKSFKALAKRVIEDLKAGDMYSDYIKGGEHVTLYYINPLTLHIVDWYAQNKLALTHKEFKIATNELYGAYAGYSEPELRRALAWDYIDIMLLSDESTPKSFAEFKKNIISQC